MHSSKTVLIDRFALNTCFCFRWFKHISTAADSYKNRTGRVGRPEAGLAGHASPHDSEASEDSPDKAKEYVFVSEMGGGSVSDAYLRGLGNKTEPEKLATLLTYVNSMRKIPFK